MRTVSQTLLGKYGTLVLLALTMVLFGLLSHGRFLVVGNLVDLVEQSSILGILALGMAFTLIGGGIDMSVGAVAGLCATVFADMNHSAQPFLFECLAALLLGALWGVLNGLVIIRLGIKPFVATLCTMFLATGVKTVINQGQPIWTTNQLFGFISRGVIAGVPLPVFLLALAIVLGFLVTDHTRYGVHLYARGGNLEAARAAGVKTGQVAFRSYIISGCLAAIGGIMLASRLSGTPVEIGEDLIVDLFTVTLVSTTVFGDGLTNVPGVLVGALLVSLVENGTTFIGLSYLYVDAMKGILVLLAGVIGFTRQRRRGEMIQLKF